MARRARSFMPGLPVHVIQRAVNGGPCFLMDGDRERYLDWLGEAASREGCSVHAYVLMTNHVHLLLAPKTPLAMPRTMHALGSRYVSYFNRRHGREGVLWERRYRSCFVDSDRYLLQCHRYIDRNPVRAGMVRDPADYRWSSHRHYAFGAVDPLLRRHPIVEGIGSDEPARQARYRAMVAPPDAEDEWAEIRKESLRDGAFGSDAFRSRLTDDLDWKPLGRRRGRPAK